MRLLFSKRFLPNPPFLQLGFYREALWEGLPRFFKQNAEGTGLPPEALQQNLPFWYLLSGFLSQWARLLAAPQWACLPSRNRFGQSPRPGYLCQVLGQCNYTGLTRDPPTKCRFQLTSGGAGAKLILALVWRKSRLGPITALLHRPRCLSRHYSIRCPAQSKSHNHPPRRCGSAAPTFWPCSRPLWFYSSPSL